MRVSIDRDKCDTWNFELLSRLGRRDSSKEDRESGVHEKTEAMFCPGGKQILSRRRNHLW
jgi:hypothetical protein